ARLLPDRTRSAQNASPSCTAYQKASTSGVGVETWGEGRTVGEGSLLSPEPPHAVEKMQARAAPDTIVGNRRRRALLRDGITFLLHRGFDGPNVDDIRVVFDHHLLGSGVAADKADARQLSHCLLDARDAVVTRDVRRFECNLSHRPASYRMIILRVACRTAAPWVVSSPSLPRCLPR